MKPKVHDFVGFKKPSKIKSKPTVHDFFNTKKLVFEKRQKKQKKHFKARFLERCGYHCTDEKYEEMCMKTPIQGKFLHIGETFGRKVYRIKWDQHLTIKVVFDSFTKTLITVLP